MPTFRCLVGVSNLTCPTPHAATQGCSSWTLPISSVRPRPCSFPSKTVEPCHSPLQSPHGMKISFALSSNRSEIRGLLPTGPDAATLPLATKAPLTAMGSQWPPSSSRPLWETYVREAHASALAGRRFSSLAENAGWQIPSEPCPTPGAFSPPDGISPRAPAPSLTADSVLPGVSGTSASLLLMTSPRYHPALLPLLPATRAPHSCLCDV